MMNIRHRLKRLLEQPSIPIEILSGILPKYSLYAITAKRLIGKDPKTIIDIGSNKGETIKAFKFHFKDVKIFAFEPLVEHFNNLKSIKNVKLYPFGLWNKNTQKTLYVNKAHDDQSSFLEPKKYLAEKRKINLKRFDNLDIELKRPCYVKIDVEGAEDKVIEGFGDKLKDVDVLQIEVLHQTFFEGQGKLNHIMNILEKYGFKGFKQIEVTHIKNKPQKSDLVFFK